MDEPWPNGESPRPFFARIQHAFTTLCDHMRTQHLPGDVAVVTYGVPTTIVYHLLKGVPWSNQHPFFPIAATGIHEVTYLEGRWQLTAENRVQHRTQEAMPS